MRNPNKLKGKPNNSTVTRINNIKFIAITHVKGT